MMPGTPAAATIDVGGAGVRGEVAGAGVAQRDRRVLGPTGEQQPERPADGQAAAHDDHLGAVELDAVATQQLDAADRRARQRAGLAEHELAEVGRVQPVDVLVGVDARQQPELVEPGRLLHQEAGAARGRR